MRRWVDLYVWEERQEYWRWSITSLLVYCWSIGTG